MKEDRSGPNDSATTLENELAKGGQKSLGVAHGRWNVATMTQVAVTVGLAAVLNMFPLFKMPQGGSVSLDMVPIFFLAFYRGVRPAVLAGAIFGIVDYSLDPFFVHPAQLILDYPLAFALVGLAGVFRRHSPGAVGAGIILGGSLRFMAHFFSGVIFFASYAPKGQSPWLYSFLYNASYLPLSVVLAIPLVYVLLRTMKAVPGGTSV